MGGRLRQLRTTTTGWSSSVASAACAFYGYSLGWLLLAVIVPLLVLQWSPSVITSGSMAPRVVAGDVVVFEPYDGGALNPGMVVTYADPSWPGRITTHRITGVNDDGTYQTKGDGNRTPDSTPLPPDEVRGVARVLVPLIGMPLLWVQEGRGWLAGLWVAFSVLVLAQGGRERRALRRRPKQWSLPAPGSQDEPSTQRPGRLPGSRPGMPQARLRSRRVAVPTVVAVVATLAMTGSAHAAFSSWTSNSPNQISAAANFGVEFVKTLGSASCGGASSVITIPAAGVAAGNTVVVQFGLRSDAAGSVAVTFGDSKANTYTIDADIAANRTRTVIASAHVANALVGGDTITLTHADDKVEYAFALELSNVAPTGRVDASATASGNSSTPSAQATTTAKRTMLVGAISTRDSHTWTESAGWTTRNHAAAVGCTGDASDHHLATLALSDPGSATYAPTLNPGREWTLALVAYAAEDRVPPPVPALSGTPGDAENLLSWTAVTDPSGVEYLLYRDDVVVYTGTATSFLDEGLVNGTPYRYTVRARDDYANTSKHSAALTLTPAAGASIKYIKEIGAASCGGASSVVTVPAAGVAAGNTLIARVLLREELAATAISVTDSKGNVYTVDREQTVGKLRVAVVSAHVTTALVSGDTITATHPDAKTESLSVAEFSGISPTNRVDVTAVTNGSSSTPSVALTTTASRTLVYAASGNVDNITYTEASGFTTLSHHALNCGGQAADSHGARQRRNTAGPVTYAPTFSGGKEWLEVMVAYRALDTVAPTAPELSATPGDTEAWLSWTTVTDPTPPVTYQLYRDGLLIYSGSDTTFHDTGRTNGTTYTYGIRATDAVGNQSSADELQVTPYGGASIQFVSSLGVTTCGGTSTTLTIPAAGVAEDRTVILGLVFREPPAGAPISASDSRGNTYSIDADLQSGKVRTAVLSARATTALQPGDTITVTHPDAKMESVSGAVFGGIASSSRVDAANTNGGDSTTPSAALTTTAERTVLFGALALENNPTVTDPDGWNLHETAYANCGGNATSRTVWRRPVTAGAKSYGPTLSGAVSWAVAMVAYRAAPLDTTAPAAPTLQGEAAETTALLTWNDVDDDTEPITYEVLRDGVSVYSGTDLSFTDTGLTTGLTYDYVVHATDAAANRSSASNTVSLTTAADVTPPPAPALSGLMGNGENVMSWTAVEDPTAPVSYELFRDGLSVYSGPDLMFTDTGLTYGAAHDYVVTAIDGNDNVSVDSNTFTPAPSTVTTALIGNVEGGITGYLRQGGGYYVYADADVGSASFTADVSAITAGQSAVALTAGAYTRNGVTYTHRSALLTADNPLGDGSTAFSVTPSGGSAVPFSVTVDNTAPTAADIQLNNKAGGSLGVPETGDTAVYTFSEPVDPDSVIDGWDGSSTTVTVYILQSGSSDDTVTIRSADNLDLLPLGSVDTNGDPVSSNATFTNSTMEMSGSTIIVTLGTIDTGARTDGKTDPSVWTPSALVLDRAGNAMSTATATESGAADPSF